MPKFGKRSKANLRNVHQDLVLVAYEAIKITDFSVLYGHRSQELQFKLYQKGRKKINGRWRVSDKSKIVTYRDGYKKLSKHNFGIARALDIAPYPIDWKNLKRFYYMAGVFVACANRLKWEGVIDKTIVWGGNWISFKDYPHFQI